MNVICAMILKLIVRVASVKYVRRCTYYILSQIEVTKSVYN